MTDMGGKLDKRKMKRKVGTSIEKQKAEKKSRKSCDVREPEAVNQVKPGTSELGGVTEKVEEGRTWTNLNLILSLRNKNIHIEKKVELAYDFIQTWEMFNGDSEEAVVVSRLLMFLNDWIQSVLIPKGNGGRDDGGSGMSMDIRCWGVFKFCLEEASRRHLSLSFSRNLLRAVVCASENALGLLDKISSSMEVVMVSGQEFEVHNVVLDCISQVFSMHSGVLSDNLDMWLSAVYAVLQLANKVFSESRFPQEPCDFSMKFCCLMLDYFSKYLKIHPCRKNGFQDFVDKLLEPLLHMFGLLHTGDDAEKLSKVVGEVLSQGLFHNVHIDGFLNFKSIEESVASSDVKPKEQKMNFKSYHRHLFGKMEKIIGEKKVTLFCGIGELFHLLIKRVKIQRGASSVSKDAHLSANNIDIERDGFSDDGSSSILSTEIRKSLFDIFAQTMEPLMRELSNYLESEFEVGPVLLDICAVLKCVNSIVNVLMQEKVYSRTEDTSEGACFDYLKKVHDVVMVFSTKVTHLWFLAYRNVVWNHTITLISEELILVVGHLLEIDYKVTGDDLVKLWAMMFSFFSFGSTGKTDSLSLRSRALAFGCQLLNLYCELRQVNSVIVSFCEAMRSLGLHNYGDDITRSLPCQLYARSVQKLIGSQVFRSTLCNAVKSIPEGQAGGFIHQLAKDMSDSVEWVKASCSAAGREDKKQLAARDINLEYLCLHMEVFGVGLSEVYSLVLDSVSVTAGNSSLVGTSTEEVIDILQPILSALVAQQPTLVDFLVSFTGEATDSKIIAKEFRLQNLRESAHLILLFFFRLYLSCRSLYRQAISLVTPKISKKMSKHMGDPVAAYSGRELLEMSDWTYEGYFSWIVQPSSSLPTIIKFIQCNFLCGGVTATPGLTYVFHIMAIHRLVDLNRQLKTFDYLQSTANRVQSQMIGVADLLSGCKISFWESHMSALRQEALELVDMMMGQLSLVTTKYETVNDSLFEVQPVKGWNLFICPSNTKSLSIAIWRSLCQNIDIWSTHVAKKQLKIFLSELLRTSVTESCELGCPEKVTIQKISLELLKNTILYEQKSVRRYLASRLCRVLKKSMLALPNSTGNINRDFSSSTSSEILTSLDSYMATVLSKKDESCELPSPAKHMCQLSTCMGFLDLLCWMPLGYLNRKSFSGLATTVLDLERFVVANILESGGALYEWFSLLLACRRALKHIVLAACEDVEAPSPFFLMTPDNSVATLWLLKTVSAMSQMSLTVSNHGFSKMRESVFTLLDHTSAIFLNLCKNQAHHTLVSKKICSKEFFVLDNSHKMDCCGDNDAWRNLVTMAETLKDETGKLDVSVSEIKGFSDNEAGGTLCGMNKLSCHISCVHGFLWGLASALAKNSPNRLYEIKSENETLSEVKVLLSMFSDFLNRSLEYVLNEHSQWPGIICLPKIKLSNGFLETSRCQQETSEPSNHTITSDMCGELDTNSLRQLLSEDDTFQQRQFNKSLLQSLLRADYPEAAFLLRQLLLAASAGMRLNLPIDRVPNLSSSVPLFTYIAQLVLLEVAYLDETPPPFSFVLLDGVLKYLEELGNHISANKSTKTMNDSYNKLIDLLLRVNGKCISFQGKRATLASHEIESSTKMLDNQTVFPTTHNPLKPNMWDEFKSRLRTSFIAFISKASEQHLLSAIQAIDRALVGVQEGSTMIYEVVTGNADGGRVSSKVAAGVDCLDLILEHASGRRRLGVVQRHIQRLVAGLFNITGHLQSQHIFIELSDAKQESAGLDPDPGAVALMCTEVLTRIFAKKALFSLDSCHVGQALRLPGALFQNFLHVKHTLVKFTSDTKGATGIDECEPALASPSHVVDRKFAIDLYASSCRLLSTVIKHHKDVCSQSIAVLEDSVSILLYCLETVSSDQLRAGYYSWQVQEGVRCATFLRRVYEELRQQKDVFGHRLYLFLSHYIWVYSGYGPNKTGIKRDIDEALKPGIYALIDACSRADLQHLHTVFGEGPCRSTLARLQQDYESNFRYTGKDEIPDTLILDLGEIFSKSIPRGDMSDSSQKSPIANSSTDEISGSSHVNANLKESLWKFVGIIAPPVKGVGGNCTFRCTFCIIQFKGPYSRVKFYLLKITNKGI
ncbi:unnamed protein product [Rhodiola kirilowii]